MYCENCGTKIEDGYGFCGECGQAVINNDLEEQPVIERSTESNKGRRASSSVIISIVILIIISLICSFVIYYSVNYYNEAETEEIQIDLDNRYNENEINIKADDSMREGYLPNDIPEDEISSENSILSNADNMEIKYRVRKSAYDSESQIGAFAILDNAIKEAMSHKDKGYKVYDMKGNLVFEP